MSKQKKSMNTSILKNTQTMVMLALFMALSIVFGKQLSITVGAIRISFENLPIIMAGIFFGPVAGAFVGGCADIIGCLIVGYSITPLVTVGCISIGFISGIVYQARITENPKLRLIISVYSAHIIGSMLIKSVGLYLHYHYAISVLLLRIPLYIMIGIPECLIIYSLLENRSFQSQLQKIKVTANK